MGKLFLYGAGGHASVITDVVRSQGAHEIVGLIDDDPKLHRSLRFGYTVIGGKEALDPERADSLFLGIGDNHMRYRAYVAFSHWRFPCLIHPTAVIGRNVVIGDGTVVMPRAVIEHGARVGSHCIINNGAVVGHNSRVEDFCHVSGNSVLGGGVTLKCFVFVGIGAVVTPCVTIGTDCLVSAGSVAAKDFPEGATIIGNPGRPLFNRRELG